MLRASPMTCSDHDSMYRYPPIRNSVSYFAKFQTLHLSTICFKSVTLILSQQLADYDMSSPTSCYLYLFGLSFYEKQGTSEMLTKMVWLQSNCIFRVLRLQRLVSYYENICSPQRICGRDKVCFMVVAVDD